MAKKPLPTPDKLRQLLRYEPDTGKLFWKRVGPGVLRANCTNPEHKATHWNSKYAGKEAFTATSASGHKRGRVLRQPFLAHRVIWAIYYGEWPDGFIDHKNMDPADNRISNLRLATKRQNGCNRKSLAGSSSRYLGVGWHKGVGKWKAAISIQNKSMYLGTYECEECAAMAYDNAAKKHHGDFASLNFRGALDWVGGPQD